MDMTPNSKAEIRKRTRTWINAKMFALERYYPPGFVKVSDSDLRRLEECIIEDYHGDAHDG